MAITITGDSINSNTDLNIQPGNSGNPLYYYTNGIRYSDRTPAFNAAGTTGWLYGNNVGGGNGNYEMASAFAWTWNQRGQGSYGMNSNGRYYAPVSGRYYFYCSTYAYNDNNSTNYVHFNFGKNNGFGWNNGRTPHTIYMHATPYNHNDGIVCHSTMYLSQGEFCSIKNPYWNSNNSSRMYSSYTLFCGALIG